MAARVLAKLFQIYATDLVDENLHRLGIGSSGKQLKSLDAELLSGMLIVEISDVQAVLDDYGFRQCAKQFGINENYTKIGLKKERHIF